MGLGCGVGVTKEALEVDAGVAVAEGMEFGTWAVGEWLVVIWVERRAPYPSFHGSE